MAFLALPFAVRRWAKAATRGLCRLADMAGMNNRCRKRLLPCLLMRDLPRTDVPELLLYVGCVIIGLQE